tara:strand:+ start:5790 stop:8060 length:2271 start_codon:yes stop_codon:yes gene_type:complete
MVNYTCEICDKVSTQKSHHEAHLNSKDHKQCKYIFVLEKQNMSVDDILKEYPEFNSEKDRLYTEYENDGVGDDDIKSKLKTDILKMICKKKETVKMDEKSDISEPNKYKPSNKVVWELSENVDNKLYSEEFKKIQSVIDKVHQFMFNTNQINGITAMRDMMKILPFILLKNYFNSEEFKENASSVMMSSNKLPKYLSYASDITKILNEENPLNNWRLFIKQLISKVLPEVFTEGDGEFEFNKKGTGEKTFKYIVREFSNIDVSEQFIEAFSTACGDIHELFRKYAGKKEAKDFGGFNTPRHALNMIYQFPPIKELIEGKIKEEDCSIYDPTMGTGGFLTRFYKTFDISADNIYGCELSPDTIKFAFVSLFMSTQKILKNCESCNSLTETNNLHKQETIGLANPPFGTSIKYKTWKKNGETFDGELETYNKKYPGHSVKFKDIYPINTNNGACLFTQHFVYKIKENGLGIIILPDGELFDGNSKWSKTFREWLLTNVNLKMIIRMPKGTFEHAGIGTNVLVFTKNGQTKNIQYFETTKECNIVREVFKITYKDIKSTYNYSLEVYDYIEKEKNNYNSKMVKLGDICDFKWGKNIPKRDRVIKSENNYPYYGSNGISGYTEKYTFEGKYMLLGDQGSQWFNSLQLTKNNEKFNISNHTISISVKDDINFDYIYSLLKHMDLKQFNKDSAMIPEINFRKFSNHEIPLPSTEIKNEIINELNKKDEIIKSNELTIDNLKKQNVSLKKNSLMEVLTNKLYC